MNTIRMSPRRELEAWLAANGRTKGAARRPSSVTATTWLGMDFRIGDRVVERGGRHPARIDAIFETLVARVTYDNGWRGDVPLADLEPWREGE